MDHIYAHPEIKMFTSRYIQGDELGKDGTESEDPSKRSDRGEGTTERTRESWWQEGGVTPKNLAVSLSSS